MVGHKTCVRKRALGCLVVLFILYILLHNVVLHFLDFDAKL